MGCGGRTALDVKFVVVARVIKQCKVVGSGDVEGELSCLKQVNGIHFYSFFFLILNFLRVLRDWVPLTLI